MSTTMTRVVALERLVPGRGVRALVDHQAVAVFLHADGSVHAVGDVDPRSGASVMARGLTGSTTIDGRAVRFVASPLRKERYALEDGRALTGAGPGLGSWHATVVDGWVCLGACRHGPEASPSGNGPETAP